MLSGVDHTITSSSSSCDDGENVDPSNRQRCPPSSCDVFERFESWLRENGASFEQLELREYNDDHCGSAFSSSKDGCDVDKSSLLPPPPNDDAEEKKESPFDVNVKSSADAPASSSAAAAGEMRGVHAKTSISPNTVCVFIPRKCLITVEMGQATEIGTQILNSDLDLDAPKHIFLMIYVLQDRLDPDSFFRPYYDILPRSLSNMPIFWSDEELRWLEGSHLLHQVEDRVEAIEEDYRAICDACPKLAEVATLEEFKWARMCVCSRNFGLQIDGSRTSALVPHADMLNHYRPRETKWTFDDERQGFTITTLQTIQAGAQIYDSYGQKCNHRFLLNYGFAVENNVELDGFCPNEVPLELSIPPSDPLFERKMDFWCREDAPAVKRVRVCASNNENTKVLFSMLRVIAADGREFDAVAAAGGGLGAGGGAATGGGGGTTGTGGGASSAAASSPFRCGAVAAAAGLGMLGYRTCRDVRFPLSMRNERAALAHLLGVVRRALSRYPTTLRQDTERLAADGLLPRFSNARHAVIQVRGEKEVLHFFEDLALTALRVADAGEEGGDGDGDGGDAAFDAAVKSLEGMGKHHLIVRYCADVIGSTRREERRRGGGGGGGRSASARGSLLSCGGGGGRGTQQQGGNKSGGSGMD